MSDYEATDGEELPLFIYERERMPKLNKKVGDKIRSFRVMRRAKPSPRGCARWLMKCTRCGRERVSRDAVLHLSSFSRCKCTIRITPSQLPDNLPEYLQVVGDDTGFVPKRKPKATRARPGSQDKLEIMATRLVQGEELHADGDLKFKLRKCAWLGDIFASRSMADNRVNPAGNPVR